LRTWYPNFYPERQEIIEELQKIAADLQGHLEEPSLRWKFAWIRPVFGWKLAKWAQTALPNFKATCIRQCDKALFRFEFRNGGWMVTSSAETAGRD